MIVNIDKVISGILLIAILFLTLCSKPSVIINEGITEDEHLYRLELFKISVENQKLKDEIQGFRIQIVKDSAFVHNASNKQVDSLFTTYFRQP